MIQISNIKLCADENESVLEKKIRNILKLKDVDTITYKISKKSIDARKEKVHILYTVLVDIKGEMSDAKDEMSYVKKAKSSHVVIKSEDFYEHSPEGTDKLTGPPIVIGSGPAGLFCAYMLADYGYSPLVIERGACVEERTKIVEEFFGGGKLNERTNVQFGEGGAGTFSDGKLNTLVKDKHLRNKLVLETFVKFGAYDNILYDAKPHIGTDVLKHVIANMRKYIESKGGRFLFNTTVTDILTDNNRITGCVTDKGDIIESNVVVLAPGHSARDTFRMLDKKGIDMSLKSFAVGLRIEHPQDLIQRNQYGKYAPCLPPASYKLTHQASNGRGIYSFCMCPGGYVVNASSVNGKLAVNGMSYNKRDSVNANSAMIVTVTPDDFDGNDIFAGVRFQEKLEKAAYDIGEGDIPVQLYGDFKRNVSSQSLGRIKPCIKGTYKLTNLNKCLPKYICDTIVEGVDAFDSKIKGFSDDEVLLSGVESRTSSPIRIVRDDITYESKSLKGLYPCGEGAGYAGGIMSAAMDGIKVFEAISNIYAP